MRIVFKKGKQKKFLEAVSASLNCQSYSELAFELKISPNTLKKWTYEKHHLPKKIFDNIIIRFPSLKIYKKEIVKIKEKNWGQTLGGRKTYQIILKKYGLEEIKRRQSKGGRASLLKKDKQAKENLKIDLDDPLFLEFYGALLGDGWLSSLSYVYKNYKKSLWWVGISGHAELDKEYLVFLKKIIKKLFNKNVIIKYKKNSKGMEILFCHKQLILFLNEKLSFPIGKKINLKIENNFARDWDKLKYVVKGLFDTDGSLYFDKNPVGNPYPIISIHMKAPILLNQVYKQLLYHNFKLRFRKNELILKGSKQLNKWMKEIGSSNPKHFSKYEAWLKKGPRGAIG